MKTVLKFLRWIFLALCSIFKKKNSNTEEVATLLSTTKKYLDKEIAENNLSPGTRVKYEALYRNLEAFLISTRQRDLLIGEVKIRLAIEFKNYLHSNLKSCCHTHAAKHIETVKRVLDYATNLELIEHNPIASYKCKRDRAKDIVHLTATELNKLKRAVFVVEIYNLVRDLYLFQCFTGLSYIDLWKYEIVTEDDITWVTCEQGRGKTHRKYWTEFTEEAAEIHNRYTGQFPSIENSTYNRIIKEVMKQIGITKHITTHTGRKTFATVKRIDGHSMPAIGTMLGNTEQVARTRYADEGKEHVKTEIIRLREHKQKKLAINVLL